MVAEVAEVEVAHDLLLPDVVDGRHGEAARHLEHRQRQHRADRLAGEAVARVAAQVGRLLEEVADLLLKRAAEVQGQGQAGGGGDGGVQGQGAGRHQVLSLVSIAAICGVTTKLL